MKEKLLHAKDTPLFHRVYTLLCVLVLAYYPLSNMTDWDSRGNYIFILQALALVMALMYCLTVHKMQPPECHILAVFFIWTFLTRAILGDLSDGLRGTILYSACACCFWGVGSLLDSQERQRLLNIVTAVVCGILFLWSVFGMLILLTGIGYLPIIHKNIALEIDQIHGSTVRYLTFYGLHRNDTAPWFMVALWLMAYQWLNCKKKLWRIPIGIAAVLFYVCIAVQHCRSVLFAVAGGFAMLAFMAAMDRSKKQNIPVRFGIAVLAAVLALGISYKGFSVSETVLNRTSDFTSRIYADLRGYELPHAADSSAEDSVSDNRNTLNDLKSMTGRKTIWNAILKTRKQDLSLAMLGYPEEHIIQHLIDSGAMKHVHTHTHNTLFQVLAVQGVPGLLMYLVFLCMLAWRMLRLFFSGTCPLAAKSLTVPIATLVVYGVTEPLLSPLSALPSLLFLLIGGIAAEYLKEDTK